MAWDIQQEGVTGDIVFSPARDIAGVDSDGLLKQRIIMRCKVPRGTYLYDLDGDFGSTLYVRAPGFQPNAVKDAVMEALMPMTDEIQIQSVDVTQDTLNMKIQVIVNFTPISTDPDIPTINTGEESFDSISVTVPQDF